MVSTRIGLAVAFVLALAGLAACSGGGGGGNDPPPPPAEPVADTAGLRCSGSGGAGWCWLAPATPGQVTHDLDFVSADEGWAVGDAGVLRHTVDGGRSWDQRFLPGESGLRALLFKPGGAEGWLLGGSGGSGGRVWRTRDRGATWQRSADVPLAHGTALEFADNGWLIARGDRGGPVAGAAAFVSADGGDSWSDAGDRLLAIDADGTRWRYGPHPEVARVVQRSSDGGRTWTAPFAQPAYTWGSSGGGHAWVLLFDGTVLRRAGTGAPWAAPTMPPDFVAVSYALFPQLWFGAEGAWSMPSFTLWQADPGKDWSARTPTQYLPLVSFADARTAWFYESTSQQVLHTVDRGLSWQSTGAAAGLVLSPPSSLQRDGGGALLLSTGAAPGSYGTVERWYRQRDGESAWQPLPGVQTGTPAGRQALYRLWLAADGRRGLATNGIAQLLQTDDGGRQWTVHPAFAGASVDGPVASPGGVLWLRAGTAFWRSSDGGRTWSTAAVQVDGGAAGARLDSITQFVDERLVFGQRLDCVRLPGVPCAVTLLRSEDGGSSWVTLGSPPAGAARVLMLDRERGVAVSTYGASVTADGGRTWVDSALPAGLSPAARLVAGAGAVWRLGAGELLRSGDGGRTWTRVALPLPAIAPEAQLSGTARQLHDLVFTGGQQAWIVGSQGVILGSADGGLSWRLHDSGTQLALHSVFALGPRAVWVAGEAETLLVSASGAR